MSDDTQRHVGQSSTKNPRVDRGEAPPPDALVPPDCTINPADLEVEIYAAEWRGVQQPNVGIRLKHKPTGRGSWCTTWPTRRENMYVALYELQRDLDRNNWTPLNPPNVVPIRGPSLDEMQELRESFEVRYRNGDLDE